MIDGALAVAVLVIVGFALFIFWAKSESGRKALRSSLGEPGYHPHRRRTHKKRPPAAKNPSRPASGAKKPRR